MWKIVYTVAPNQTPQEAYIEAPGKAAAKQILLERLWKEYAQEDITIAVVVKA